MSLDSLNWYRVRNTEAESAPAFAVMRVVGVDSDGTLQVAQPNADSLTDVIFNGPTIIPPAGYGQGYQAPVVAALYDPSDGTPAVDETWGAAEDEWWLQKDNTGFVVKGAGDGTTASVMPAFLSALTAQTILQWQGTGDNVRISTAGGNNSSTFTICTVTLPDAHNYLVWVWLQFRVTAGNFSTGITGQTQGFVYNGAAADIIQANDGNTTFAYAFNDPTTTAPGYTRWHEIDYLVPYGLASAGETLTLKVSNVILAVGPSDAVDVAGRIIAIDRAIIPASAAYPTALLIGTTNVTGGSNGNVLTIGSGSTLASSSLSSMLDNLGGISGTFP